MARPPALTPSPVGILIDRLNAWLRWLADATDALKGGGGVLVAGNAVGVSYTASAYLADPSGKAMSATHGYIMPKAGSIVASSIVLTVTTMTDMTLTLEVRVNDVPMLTATKVIPVKDIYSWYATAPRHTHKFAAGDLVQFYLKFTGTSCTLNSVLVLAEVRFDT